MINCRWTGVCFAWLLILNSGTSWAQNDIGDRPNGLPASNGISRNIDYMALWDDVSEGGKAELHSAVFDVDTKFASTASKIAGTYLPGKVTHSPEDIKHAANEFLKSLSEAQKEKVVHKLDSEERAKWTNLPARRNAGGIRLGDLDETQLKATFNLLAHLLSRNGYEKMRLIMLADDQLLKNGQRRPGFGTEDFSVVIFGSPSETELWAFQLDGHHLGLNVAIHGENITIAPSFIGSQPSRYKLGGHEFRPLAIEYFLALRFARMLSEDQFKEALVGDTRGQILAGPGKDDFTMKPRGLECSKLDDKQKLVMLKLIEAWVGNLPEDHARKRMQEIEAGLAETRFAWSGPRKPGSDFSYTIQGPSMIIEFALQDLGGDPMNHVHTQYRNPNNDYGKAFAGKSTEE